MKLQSLVEIQLWRITKLFLRTKLWNKTLWRLWFSNCSCNKVISFLFILILSMNTSTFWNCRGASDKNFSSKVKTCFSHKVPDLLVLLKTKIKGAKCRSARNGLTNSSRLTQQIKIIRQAHLKSDWYSTSPNPKLGYYGINLSLRSDRYSTKQHQMNFYNLFRFKLLIFKY